VIGGLAAGVAGGYLAVSAQHTIDNIDAATFYDDFVARSKEASSAKTKRLVGFGIAGAGAALVISGIITYVVRSPKTETVQVSIGPRGELGVAWAF
jgi:hypothetical protein